MSKLLIIDGNAIMHRAYHAMPPLTTPDKEPIGAVQGFLNIFLKLLDGLEPTHLAVCWDRKEPTFRKKKYKQYQSHRPPTEKELSSQFSKINKVLETFNVSQFDKIGYEADDLIGTLAKNSKTDEVVIVTGDKDQLQLVDDRIRVYLPGRGLGNGKILGPKEVKEKLGVAPEQVIDLKAFMGDQSDNYPGIYGVGPKTAEELLTKYKTYHEVFKHLDELPENLRKKLEKGKKDGDISYELAKIVTDMKIDIDEKDLSEWDIGNEKTLKLFADFGFRSLTRRVQGKTVKRINKSPSKKDIEKVVKKIAKLLEGENYAFRGTVSLVLQGFDMGVDDIDILTDKKTALNCNKLLKEYLYEKVEFKESEKYKSYFGKFVVDKVLVEVYGEWQIRQVASSKKQVARGTLNTNWSEAFVPTEDITTEVKVGDTIVRVTTIEHELDIFVLEGRWNALHKMNRQIQSKRQGSLFDQ